jgi:hypothetical protein
MKKLIFIVSIVLCGITVLNAQERCDTLKLKCIKTGYCKFVGDSNIRKLDGAVINIDSFPVITIIVGVTNVSNDTFLATNSLNFFSRASVHTDTGWFGFGAYAAAKFERNFLPNDSSSYYTGIIYEFNKMLNELEENDGITIDKISYFQSVIFVNYTDKDGLYSDSVFWAGADTSTFRIVKNGVGIKNLLTKQKDISIFPNPAQSQFTVTNAQDAMLRMYNILGQEVVSICSEGENAIINTNHLPRGLYVLKIEKENAILIRKVQIMR